MNDLRAIIFGGHADDDRLFLRFAGDNRVIIAEKREKTGKRC